MNDGFYARLAMAQAEFSNAALDEENPFDRFKYASYASLVAAARPHLNKHRIAALHFVECGVVEANEHNVQEHWVGIKTVLRDDSESYDAGTIWIPVLGRSLRGGGVGPIDAQAYGAAITYGKRYGLELALGIGREDEGSVDQQPARTAQPRRSAQGRAQPPSSEQGPAQPREAAQGPVCGPDTDLDTVELEHVGQLMEIANKVFNRPVASVLHALGVERPPEIGDPNEALRQLRALWAEPDEEGASDHMREMRNGG